MKMAGYLDLCYFYLFILINNVKCSILFPRSQRYQTVHLMDTMICHARHPLQLSSGLNSAIIIETDKRFNRWYNKTNDLRCKFVIKVPKGEHLFAVVQSLSFRRGDHGCIDYIEFRRKGEIDADQRICGKFNRRNKKITHETKFEALNHARSHSNRDNDGDDDDEDDDGDDDDTDEDDDDIYHYSSRWDESDHDGEIETTVFVSRKSLQTHETLNLTIAYTPYKDCDKVNPDDYGPTSSYDICLWKEYFCDGVQNCASDLCADEQYCSNDIFGNGSGTKLTIGAIITIILCFLKFFASLWICKRYNIFCWSPDCMGPPTNPNNNNNNSNNNSNRNVRNIDREIDNFSSNHQSSSVPPVLLVSVLPSSHDKDLPPSYESLFPERVNPAAPTQSS